MSNKTIDLIQKWINHSVFHNISEETNAYTLWKKLEDML